MAAVTVPLGPPAVNITGVRAGDRNLMTVSVTTAGVPVDLTGLTPAAQARKKSIDPDPPVITAVVTVTDAPAGELEIRWPGDQVTTALAGKETWSGVWDLQLDPAADDPITVCAGTFAAVMDVTRP